MRKQFCLVVLLLLALPTLLLSCNVVSGKPSASVPGGVDSVSELSRACSERLSAIRAWEAEKQAKVDEDFFSGEKRGLESLAEAERVSEEADDMRRELMENCREREEEIAESASGPESGARQASRCGDCFSVSRLSEQYEANAYATALRYGGTRHNFGGIVESVDREPSVPPKPLIRVVAEDGARLTFRFDWDGDYGWVSGLKKGDWVKVNCEMGSLGTSWEVRSGTVTPYLSGCTKVD